MNKKLMLACLVFSVLSNFLFGQRYKKLNFDEKLGWEKIKEKAKREKKYIFVDCYATWCGPCKGMDKDVYPTAEVGDAFNDRFVSIRLQMDKTSDDNEYIRSWYATAEKFQREYKLLGYPAFLFFSSDGTLLHQGFGYKSKDELISLSEAAVDPNKQYFSLLEKYKAGKINRESDIRNFINIAANNGDRDFSEKVAAKFKIDFLDKLTIDQICSAENLKFAEDHTSLINSHDNFFSLFWNYPGKSDSIELGLAKKVVRNVIQREEIIPALRYNDPLSTNWDSISSNIISKYGNVYAEELLPPIRMRFAYKTRSWNEYARLKEDEIAKKNRMSNIDTLAYSWELNKAAWDTYLECTDSTVLHKALLWSNHAILITSSIKNAPSDQYFDTNARLLYKLGRFSEAVENEEKAIKIGMEISRLAGINKSPFYDEFSNVLSRMKNGQSIDDLK
jgi:thioredoxin-related protein